MDQATHHAALGEVIQVLARLTETRATQERGADPEFTVDEMIERDAGSRDVAAGLRSGELDPEPFALSVEHAAQKRVARLFRVKPSSREVPIAFKSASGARPYFGDRLHRCRRFRRDVDGDDVAFTHSRILSTLRGVSDKQSPSL